MELYWVFVYLCHWQRGGEAVKWNINSVLLVACDSFLLQHNKAYLLSTIVLRPLNAHRFYIGRGPGTCSG